MRQEIEHVLFIEVTTGAHRFDGFEGTTTGEHRESPQQRTLGFREQLVAPVDRGAQGLLARQRSPIAAGQQAETVA